MAAFLLKNRSCQKNKGKIISQELDNSVVVGRAAANPFSRLEEAVKQLAPEERPDFEIDPTHTFWEHYSKPIEHKQEISNSDNLLNRIAREDQSLIKQINLDLCFARIGTLAMVLRSILSGFFGSGRDNDINSTKTHKLDVFDDFLHKIRQLAQYSIHAQQGNGFRKPDDITSDSVENMVAASLGHKVYGLNAFVAPWFGLFKAFFPYHDNPIWGFVPRMVDFCDNATGKLTNMFWNIRRIGKAFVAYDGGIRSDAFIEKQNAVRDVISHYANRYLFNPNSLIFKPLQKLWNKIFGASDSTVKSDFEKYSTQRQEEKVKALSRDMWTNFKNNFHAIWSPTYRCAHQDGKLKKIGIEEPENQKWYVRLKIASKCLGLPAGILGSILNGTGIGLNFLGSFFNIKSLKQISDKATDFANGLMSLVYLTGEVPANLNEFIKKHKDDPSRTKNLMVFGIGMLGMLNRIKILPVFSSLMNFIKLKPLLDKCDKVLRHFFLLFFSYNRLVLHSDEKRERENLSSVKDIIEADKHNNIRSHLFLPFRVLFGDDQVISTVKPNDSQGE